MNVSLLFYLWMHLMSVYGAEERQRSYKFQEPTLAKLWVAYRTSLRPDVQAPTVSQMSGWDPKLRQYNTFSSLSLLTFIIWAWNLRQNRIVERGRIGFSNWLEGGPGSIAFMPLSSKICTATTAIQETLLLIIIDDHAIPIPHCDICRSIYKINR